MCRIFKLSLFIRAFVYFFWKRKAISFSLFLFYVLQLFWHVCYCGGFALRARPCLSVPKHFQPFFKPLKMLSSTKAGQNSTAPAPPCCRAHGAAHALISFAFLIKNFCAFISFRGGVIVYSLRSKTARTVASHRRAVWKIFHPGYHFKLISKGISPAEMRKARLCLLRCASQSLAHISRGKWLVAISFKWFFPLKKLIFH
ncbi:hypothetical protein [Draconibacterium halophilum]|uniref:Uncharacterized protein n=1 Tax=Draconibacterium halophilum TaxID=2706887 RepID=A0A6C0RGQ8_9BACT|nr:hypothetical protein [Draconibacterium halophilum]QIA08261.1 hypothetical protein G0Q07_11285 [Draconibacterium halophilum]